MDYIELTSVTWTFSHDHKNDTTVTFTPNSERSELELNFDHEDPDVGREVLYYGGDGTLSELASSLYEELATVNDKLDAGEELTREEELVYFDYTLNALAAFQNVAAYLREGG